MRRDRLEEIGGFPHEAVSEDINLTYTMMRHGYVTRWLNERLSVGLAAEGLPVTLAVSLHTPDDELRDTLVPVNNRWKVAEVLDAARRYARTTGCLLYTSPSPRD